MTQISSLPVAAAPGLAVLCLTVLCLTALGACGEAEAPTEAEPPPPALVQDARALAAVLEADESAGQTGAADRALLEDRGVRAGVLIRTRVLPLLAARIAALEALELRTEEGRQMRGVAVSAYGTRRRGLEEQAALLEAADGEGLPYLDAVQLERRGVQNIAQLAAAIQAVLEAEAGEGQR